jgi:hypothetical protein
MRGAHLGGAVSFELKCKEAEDRLRLSNLQQNLFRKHV